MLKYAGCLAISTTGDEPARHSEPPGIAIETRAGNRSGTIIDA